MPKTQGQLGLSRISNHPFTTIVISSDPTLACNFIQQLHDEACVDALASQTCLQVCCGCGICNVDLRVLHLAAHCMFTDFSSTALHNFASAACPVLRLRTELCNMSRLAAIVA